MKRIQNLGVRRSPGTASRQHSAVEEAPRPHHTRHPVCHPRAAGDYQTGDVGVLFLHIRSNCSPKAPRTYPGHDGTHEADGPGRVQARRHGQAEVRLSSGRTTPAPLPRGMCWTRRCSPLWRIRATAPASPARSWTIAPRSARWPPWRSQRDCHGKADPQAIPTKGSTLPPMRLHLPQAATHPTIPQPTSLALAMGDCHGPASASHGTRGSAHFREPAPTPTSAPPATAAPTRSGDCPRILGESFFKKHP